MTIENQHIPIVNRDSRLSRILKLVSLGQLEIETVTQYGFKDAITGQIVSPEFFRMRMMQGEAVYVSDLSKTVHRKSRIVKVVKSAKNPSSEIEKFNP